MPSQHLSAVLLWLPYKPSGNGCSGREGGVIRLPMMCTGSQQDQVISMLLCSVNVKEALETDPEAYYTGDEMLQPLMMMYNSLHATNDDSIGNGRLLDVIRQVSPFPALAVHASNVAFGSIACSALDC